HSSEPNNPERLNSKQPGARQRKTGICSAGPGAAVRRRELAEFMRSGLERTEMGITDRLSELSLAGTNQVTLRNILLATDFSQCSARALDYAVGIASRYESQLYLFHCIDPAPYSLADPDVVWQTRDDIRRQLENLVLDLHREGRGRN